MAKNASVGQRGGNRGKITRRRREAASGIGGTVGEIVCEHVPVTPGYRADSIPRAGGDVDPALNTSVVVTQRLVKACAIRWTHVSSATTNCYCETTC